MTGSLAAVAGRRLIFIFAFAVFIALAAQPRIVAASRGDRGRYFSKCVAFCKDACGDDIDKGVGFSGDDADIIFYAATRGEVRFLEVKGVRPKPLSLLERLLWTCKTDCRYKCMHADVKFWKGRGFHYRKNYPPVQQYDGKWPFVRVFGAQEPASVLFSVGNGAVHLYFFLWGNFRCDDANWFYGWMWRRWAMAGIFAWACSTIFHITDTPLTERLDYHSASLYICWMAASTASDFFKPRTARSLGCIIAAFMAIWVGLLLYLNLVKFDYSLNTAVNACVFFLNVLFWLCTVGPFLCAKSARCTAARNLPRLGIGGVLLCTAIAGSFEVFDFPPLYATFDAHSIWHLATIPLSFWAYRCVMIECSWRRREKGWAL
eukprot:g5196.t1